MKTKDIYMKTMKFVWLKLGLGLGITALSAVLFGICMGIGALISGDAFIIMLCIWMILTVAMYKYIMSYFGYMLKAAHIAVITKAVADGQVPDNMVEAGKEMVKQRFATSNVYFVIDNLISGAVKQLQSKVDAVGNIFEKVPGMEALVSFAKIFIEIALGYVDECCLGYTFLKTEDNAFKAGCDGVVIYFQNAKKLLKNAAGTALVVILAMLVATIVPMFVLIPICGALNIHAIVGVILSIMISSVIRTAFIDSYMLVKTMKSYMEVAPSTEVSVDIYGKLCKISGKFKQLFNKSQENTAVA